MSSSIKKTLTSVALVKRKEPRDLTQEMALAIYGSYATTAGSNNQIQPARQECIQEADAGPSTIRNTNINVDPLTIPRTPQHIYSAMELRHPIPTSLNSSQQQNSDRGSPASSDGQVNVLINYELYNPSNTSTSNPYGSISEYTPSLTGSTLPSFNENVEVGMGSLRPAIRQHFWIQQTQVTPTKTLNCHVSESFTNGVITFYCAWPGCTHPMGFPQKAQVITHVRSAHLQEKPYICTTCNTTFARKQDANRHVVSLNRGKQYRCSVCHRAYSRRHYRNEHEERCLREASSGSPDFEPNVYN